MHTHARTNLKIFACKHLIVRPCMYVYIEGVCTKQMHTHMHTRRQAYMYTPIHTDGNVFCMTIHMHTHT